MFYLKLRLIENILEYDAITCVFVESKSERREGRENCIYSSSREELLGISHVIPSVIK